MQLSPRWYLWATGIKPEHIYREVKSHRGSPHGNPCAKNQATQRYSKPTALGIENW